MAVARYFYSDTISNFLNTGNDAIMGQLHLNATLDINKKTTDSWNEEFDIMKEALQPYKEKGTVFFEYNIPRMGRRVDVIALIENVVFVIEFKTADQKFTRDALLQVWDYAIDLKNFQEGSLDRTIVPILVAPSEKEKNCKLALCTAEDGVYQPLLSNSKLLPKCFCDALASIGHSQEVSLFQDIKWARSGYSPTPTIIEAALALFERQTVEDITKHDGDIEMTVKSLRRIINDCRDKKRKAICFVTGVPGAGKTLIGLQTAIEEFQKGNKAVYLSGNFPLVKVLQEALTRDYVMRSKQEYRARIIENGGDKTGIEKPCTKEEARSKVKAFIQMIHHYRDLYLEGTRIEKGEIIPIEGYFQSHTDKAYIPAENVAIFDEAQRAWTKQELARFMKEKKQISDFPYSEPEYLISCMDRQTDWGLVICLIGGGQEINKGEAGIEEWIKSLNRRFPKWDIFMSDKLREQEYMGGKALESIEEKRHLYIEPALHLSVSMRSFRAEKVSLFVHQLLALEPEKAKATLNELTNYPIVLTRDLDKAKDWLRSKARGSERVGMLACSKAERLKAININVRYKPDFVHWFLEDDSDIRSSNALEDTLTEFEVQGLEIDWACVAWDADLRLNNEHTSWQHFQLRSGTKWQNINSPANRTYQINAYRVLLTRARQGMVIVIPNGDHGVPPDETRKPEWYDGIYSYLRSIGLPEI